MLKPSAAPSSIHASIVSATWAGVPTTRKPSPTAYSLYVCRMDSFSRRDRSYQL